MGITRASIPYRIKYGAQGGNMLSARTRRVSSVDVKMTPLTVSML